MSKGRKTPRWVLWIISIVVPLLIFATMIAIGRLHQEMDQAGPDGEQDITKNPGLD